MLGRYIHKRTNEAKLGKIYTPEDMARHTKMEMYDLGFPPSQIRFFQQMLEDNDLGFRLEQEVNKKPAISGESAENENSIAMKLAKIGQALQQIASEAQEIKIILRKQDGMWGAKIILQEKKE